MEILTSVRRLYIRFKSLVNDFVYSFGRAALLLLVEVQNNTVPVRERRRIRDIIRPHFEYCERLRNFHLPPTFPDADIGLHQVATYCTYETQTCNQRGEVKKRSATASKAPEAYFHFIHAFSNGRRSYASETIAKGLG